MRKLREKLHTISGRYYFLLISLVAVICVLVGAAAAQMNAFYRQQNLSGYRGIADNQISQFEATMKAISTSEIQLVSSDSAVEEMQLLPDAGDRIIETVTVYRRIGLLCTQYPIVSCSFVHGTISGETMFYQQGSLDYRKKVLIRDRLSEEIENGDWKTSSGWSFYTVDDEICLLYQCATDDAAAGCLIRVTDMLDSLGGSGDTAEIALIQNGVPVIGNREWEEDTTAFEPERETYTSGGKRYYQIVEELGSTGCQVVFRYSAPRVALKITPVTVILAILCILLIIGIFAVSMVSFTKPVKTMIDTMNGSGEEQTPPHIDENAVSDIAEFQQIAKSYNASLDRIETLTARTMAEEKEKQQARLNALRAQISPHFLMNSLNIIYSASKAGRSEVAEEMSLHLSSYFRSSMQTDNDFFPLSEERQMTDDYLKIQALRYGSAFRYEILIPGYLSSALVPPMVIKSFVENSFKYGMKTEHFRIAVSADCDFEGREPILHLRIEDNGPGYPDEMTGKSTEEFLLSYDTKKHTGIRNLIERMKLLYGDRASIGIGNAEQGGAVTDIYLPFIVKSEQEQG